MKTHRRSAAPALLVGAAISAVGMAIVQSVPVAAAAETSGAFGASARVKLAGIAVNVPQIPKVTCSGDTHSASLASVILNGGGSLDSSAHILDAQCSGNTASADVADVSLFGGLLQATVLKSSCDGSTASSSIASLHLKNFLGATVAVAPNSTVTIDLSPLDKATIRFNEQSISSSGETIVDALHIHVAGTLSNDDIVLAQSRCAPTQPGSNVPEAPVSILLLGAGAAVMGGTMLVRRRRTASAS
jgi:hypothetical protein